MCKGQAGDGEEERSKAANLGGSVMCYEHAPLQMRLDWGAERCPDEEHCGSSNTPHPWSPCDGAEDFKQSQSLLCWLLL